MNPLQYASTVIEVSNKMLSLGLPISSYFSGDIMRIIVCRKNGEVAAAANVEDYGDFVNVTYESGSGSSTKEFDTFEEMVKEFR